MVRTVDADSLPVLKKAPHPEKYPFGQSGYFTLVFRGDLRKFSGNVLRAASVFGQPIAAGLGNAFDEIDRLPADAASSDAVLEAMVRAHDAEDASHMGEPSPWDIYIEDIDPDWREERIASMRAAVEIQSALLEQAHPTSAQRSASDALAVPVVDAERTAASLGSEPSCDEGKAASQATRPLGSEGTNNE